MSEFGWSYGKSGLGLREDEFSWQASIEADKFFFLRRLKNEPNVLSDFALGSVDEHTASKHVAEFLSITGSSSLGEKIVLTSIGSADSDRQRALAASEPLVRVLTHALNRLSLVPKHVGIDKLRSQWCLVVSV
ncbi:hypothetical protein [Ruegeria sp. HKCCA6707]|uniref:hypothetical protein n=1 Tax=Ruegeria sp. HKCCA6707 TaxID=2682996 RepID=UPI001487F925|nr:hypothetical protein [Ruegeria sp. HKCCA6707]